MSPREDALLALGRWLAARNYRFVTVTPRTHAIANQSRRCDSADDSALLREVFGWNRPFAPGAVPAELIALLRAADAARPLTDGNYQATVRFSTVGDELFLHSSFPTTVRDAVFFGPDSYRFVRAIAGFLPARGRLLDIGCGSGVGGITAKKHAPALDLVLADINPAALSVARVNVALAGVDAAVIESDVLKDVEGDVDVVISNPPYLRDAEQRAYRDGGQHFGARLSARIVEESLQRFAARGGGRLLLYSGTAVVGGRHALWDLIERPIRALATDFKYEELDPDVFAEELRLPAYQGVERIAVVFLRADVEG